MEATNLELEIQKVLFEAILNKGCQNLVQASMRTGYGVDELSRAKTNLIERELIRPIQGREFYAEELLPYEANL